LFEVKSGDSPSDYTEPNVFTDYGKGGTEGRECGC
jgi:hypothetical protein